MLASPPKNGVMMTYIIYSHITPISSERYATIFISLATLSYIVCYNYIFLIVLLIYIYDSVLNCNVLIVLFGRCAATENTFIFIITRKNLMALYSAWIQLSTDSLRWEHKEIFTNLSKDDYSFRWFEIIRSIFYILGVTADELH